jgi:hypothetical protein
MARPLRIELPNSVYYVTSRALEGQGMVRDEQDCAKWFARLDAVATRHRWRVFACAIFGVTEDQLRQRRRRGNQARAVALYLCQKWTGLPTADLGTRFGGVSHQAVSKMALRVARDLADDKALAEQIGRCEAELWLK